MKIERLLKLVILIILTTFVLFQISFSLVQSWSQPQIQSRLELYQTSLLLHASEWLGQTTAATPDLTNARDALIGEDPVKNAKKQYAEAITEAQTTQRKIFATLKELSSPEIASSNQGNLAQPQLKVAPLNQSPVSVQQQQQLQKSLSEIQKLIAELNLRLGILQAEQGEVDTALKTWGQLSQAETTAPTAAKMTSSAQTALVLMGMWSEPPRLLPNAEVQIQRNLDSWFRYQSLTKLYQLQQRQEQLVSLQSAEQEIAEQAIFKLALIAGIPGICGLLGVTLLLFLLGQRLWRGGRAILATNGDLPWDTPWNGETIWQVLILGFFFIGQVLLPYFILPFCLGWLGLEPGTFTVRMKAFYTLFTYLLLAWGGLLVLYLSIKPFFPLAEDWFRWKWRSNWFLWGLGGYLVALPLVILVSLINQQLWQGQGGSNPILPLVLQGQDRTALLIFFFTACLAAPLFEEMMFRGFLLPSLTRYLSVSGAIVASSLLFAIAHLSLSEVLPLTTLGIVLGVVYTRSRSLLAPMLLHSLWNSGTLLSLFILGSGST